ncbi:uncharacterized protein LOC129262945 [Lytechinus pictus]|uniref:uncharacterized protein LOC129262945 n=1 Tax=Lytechinus pictus TaxID=7653 RepID=UPI0030B9BCD8
MNKKIGFIGFVPRNHGIRKGFPVKIAFFHQSHHYQIAQIIAEHERWVGYEPNTRAISVMLDTDSDVILETSSRKGVTQKRVITKVEMKCLMHYIVFFLKDYDIKNNQVIQEMNINILQDNRLISTILIKEVFCIVRGRGTVQVDFEEPTAYQTIGKEGISYGLYENRQMGISIEVRLTDPSEDHGIKIGISSADLMEGVSETDDVAICPTVNVGGNFEGSPVEMILSHCAELSQAALEGKGKVVVYHKSEKGSDHTEGGGGVSRRELSPSECTITKDKLLFNLDKPGLYTASMKDDMCVGKRVAMLAFLPSEMPKNRRPIIHLQFYFPFGELGQRLCDEWKAKDCVCVKDETTFILKQIGQDAKVEFETKFTQELSSILETKTLEIISYECLDFELDYSRLKTNDVDATVRIIQGECRAEIEIQGTLTDDMQQSSACVDIPIAYLTIATRMMCLRP